GSACSPLASAVHIRVTKESDFTKRTRHAPSTTVILELQNHVTLKRGLLFGPEYACTVLRSGGGAKGRGYRLYVHRVDEPLLRVWNTSNVIVQRVQVGREWCSTSRMRCGVQWYLGNRGRGYCLYVHRVDEPLLRVWNTSNVLVQCVQVRAMLCGALWEKVPLLYVHQVDEPLLRVWNTSNVIVQRVQMSQPFRAYSPACPREIPDVGTDIICPLIHVYRSYGVQIVKGYTFGRVDVMRTMHSRIDSMEMTAVSDFKRGNGVIRVMLSGYGPLLVRCHVYITNNEIYGAYMPVLLHVGAVGAVVRNNYVHDFVFAAITCGNMVHSQGDCMLSTISNNLVVAAGRNLTGGWDATGIYFVTHWINPGNLAECNYVIGGDHCYYLDYASSGVTIRGGACIGTVDGMKVNNGKWNRVSHVAMKGTEGTPGRNRISHVVMKGTEGTPGWCACLTATICNCLKDPGNYWDRMRAKYYNSPVFQQKWPWMKSICSETSINGVQCNTNAPGTLKDTETGKCSGLPTNNYIDLVLVDVKDAELNYRYCYEKLPNTPKLNTHQHVNVTSRSAKFFNYDSNDLGVMKSSPIFKKRPGFKSCPRKNVGPKKVRALFYHKKFGIAKPLQFTLVKWMNISHFHDPSLIDSYSWSLASRSFAMRRYLLPLFARFVNFATRLVDALCGFLFLPPLATRLLQWLLPLEERAVLRAAYKATGLRDYGEGTFLTGLRLLLKGLEEEARLSAFGRILIWNDVQRLLRYRLQLEDTRRRHPEIEEEKIEAPVFILGLPRTGTTFLFNLLALDTSLFRSPLTWEVHHMHPPPDATCYDTDKRIGETEAFLEGVSALLPSFQALHPVTATGPQECMGLMMYDFTSFAFPTIHFNIPSYFRWYLSSDLTSTYRLLRWQLQYLQWRGPKAPRWLLKCPAHLFSLPALMTAFPDAKLIFTHRNPLTVLASAHSLIRGIRSIHSDHVDKSEISQTWVPAVASALAEMMRLRGIDGAGMEGKGGACEGVEEEETGGEKKGHSDGSTFEMSQKGGACEWVEEEEVTGDQKKGHSDGSNGYVTVTKGEKIGGGEEMEGSAGGTVSSGSTSNGSSPIGVNRSDTSSSSGNSSNELSSVDSADVLLALRTSQAVDVCYSDLVADPMATVRRIYRDLLKRQLDDDVADKMHAYLAANSKEKRPRHHYKWEDTMLDRQEEKQRFDFYIRAFGLKSEQ
ncbi:unnamed protein product, partial [Closterium sp. Yama58-4]